MPKSKTAPRNYIATVAYRRTLEEDGGDDIIRQYVLPHEANDYAVLLDTISSNGYILVHADALPIAEE